MANIRDIRKRIKAVGNIQRITRTMQMIATAKFQASVRRAQATQPFSDKLAEIVAELAEAAGDVDHPLLGAPPRPTGRKMLLVLSSNRGLCGAYNAGVLREAHRFIRNSTDQILLDVAGKKGIAYFRFAEIPIEDRHTEFDDKTTYEQVEQLGDTYIQRYLKGEFDELSVAYTRFISNARQTPEVVKILPMEKPQADEAAAEKPGANAVFEFSPSPVQLLDDLLPLAVKTRLFQFFNDANVSEQIARMGAMKSATDNAGKMRNNLKRQFNRARQSQITTELSEIIGGAAALE
ncbi:MAG: ATP synthase F1 subunit gamma [Phycisphaeraceae bacterium]|nr:ATP synthase F1 subunit gamma [Phycisphaeraceae bacterium]